jgi:hypothetical protein
METSCHNDHHFAFCYVHCLVIGHESDGPSYAVTFHLVNDPVPILTYPDSVMISSDRCFSPVLWLVVFPLWSLPA